MHKPYSTTLFTVPILHLTPEGPWAQRLRDNLEPEPEIRRLRYAKLRTRGIFSKPIQEGVPEMRAARPERQAEAHHTFNLQESRYL